MKKPRWLKSSFIKALLSHAAVQALAGDAKAGNGPNVLIHSTDGLGDAILRLSIVEALAQKHGKKNVWVLTRPASRSLYEKLGLQTISYTDRCRTGIFKRLKLIKTLQYMEFGTAYVLDFRLNENLIELIQPRTMIGFSREPGSGTNWIPAYTATVVHPGYVGDALGNFCELVEIECSVMDNTTILGCGGIKDKRRSKKHNRGLPTSSKTLRIAVAIGASNKSKIMRAGNLAIILCCIQKKWSNVTFTLFGFGKLEERYATTVETLYRAHSNRSLDNKVSAFNLDELINQMCDFDLLIGFDSALYNLAFTMRTPTLCLAYGDHSVLHSKPWVRVVIGSGAVWGEPDKFGCACVNSINPADVVGAVDELLHYNQ